MHAVLGVSDTVTGGLLGFLGVVVTTVGVVIVAALNRSTKTEARTATSGVVTVTNLLNDALQRVHVLEQQEDDCLDALQWSHGQIALLQRMAGLEETPPPAAISRRRRRPHA